MAERNSTKILLWGIGTFLALSAIATVLAVPIMLNRPESTESVRIWPENYLFINQRAQQQLSFPKFLNLRLLNHLRRHQALLQQLYLQPECKIWQARLRASMSEKIAQKFRNPSSRSLARVKIVARSPE